MTCVYERFTEIAEENTAIIVTHRLGSCRIADGIIALDNGKVVEYGSHDELVDKNDLYAHMWEA